jgi:hypothetical protein
MGIEGYAMEPMPEPLMDDEQRSAT